MADYDEGVTRKPDVYKYGEDFSRFIKRYNYEDQAITVGTQTELKDIQDRKIGAVKSEGGNVKKGKVNKVSKVNDGEVKDGEVKDGKVKDGEAKDCEVKDCDFIDGDFMDSDFMDSGFMDLKGDEFMDYGDGRSCKDEGYADLDNLRCEIRADLIEEMRERIRDEIWEEVKEGLVDELRKEVKEELKGELWKDVRRQEKHSSADYKLECVDGVKRRLREGPLKTIWEGRVNNHEDCGDHVMMTGSAGREEYPDIEHSVIYDQAPLEKKIQPVTMAEIRGETEKDPVLKLVAGWLQKGERPKSIQNTMQPDSLVSLWKSYELLVYKEGVVYRRWTALKQPFMEKDLIVVPHVLQERLLTYYHCGVLSVHAGVETCLGNCLRRFWWSKMRKEFKLFIGACVKCNHIKRPRAYLKAPLQPILNSQFNSCVAIDHIVPSLNNKCFGGFRYILTIVDCFSNYLVAIPVKTQSAEETVRVIIQAWILKHGMMQSILSDRQQNFCSDLFTGIMDAFGVEARKSSAYKGSTNGRVERQNERINGALRAVMPEGELNSWPKYLPYVVSALNTFKNKHTGFSANFLTYGRELRFPQEFFVDQGPGEEESLPVQTKAYQLYRRMKETYFKARENARVQAKYMKTQYDKRVNLHVFKPGDQCFVFINGDRPKFARRWNGPFLVAKRISDHTYVILVDPDEEVYETVNIQKMKPYVPNKYSPVMGGAGRDEKDRSYTSAEEDDEELEWTRIEIREPLHNGDSVLEERRVGQERSNSSSREETPVGPEERPGDVMQERPGGSAREEMPTIEPEERPKGSGETHSCDLQGNQKTRKQVRLNFNPLSIPEFIPRMGRGRQPPIQYPRRRNDGDVINEPEDEDWAEMSTNVPAPTPTRGRGSRGGQARGASRPIAEPRPPLRPRAAHDKKKGSYPNEFVNKD